MTGQGPRDPSGPNQNGDPDQTRNKRRDQGDGDRTRMARNPTTGARIPNDGTADTPDRTRIHTPSGYGVPPVPPGPGRAENNGAMSASQGLPPLPLPGTPRLVTPSQNTRVQVIVGTLINNNYQVTAVLRAGGMGEVYRGIEIGTGDPVAIKAILPELAEDEKAGLLFKREARTLRQLSDEAIVRYYNYVHDRELDRYFLIMEFIEGVPLSEHITGFGPIPVDAGRTLLRRLAKGLAKAHAQDVVHRDLSPDNVMLPGGAVQEARLIDFGIAKSNVVKEGTMAGQFAGKFKYVAPEQLGHYDAEIGPRTDIYGLALLVCAAVLGRPLDMGGSIVEAVTSRMAIPDLSGVPDALRPILSHMLEPDPAGRPASMDDVCRFLEHPATIPAKYIQGRPVPPAMDPTGRGSLPPVTLTTSTQGLQVPMTLGGAFPQTLPPQTAPPRPAPSHTASRDDGPRDPSGGRLLTLLGLVFVAMLGAAVWFGWSEGLIAPNRVPEDAGGVAGTGTPSAQGIPPPDSTTREGFLAAFDTGPCTYASRIASGPNAGMVTGYSATGSTFAGLPAAYEETFGARPAILPRDITAAQCPALDFARAVQGRGGAPVQLTLSQDQIASGDTLRADLTLPGNQAIWAVLISPQGTIWGLTPLLSEPVGGRRSMSFGLTLADDTEAAPQLVLVVASDAPLTRAAAAQEGAQAVDLLPIVLDEIAARGTGFSAALGYVMLTQADDDAGDAPD